MNVEIKNCPIEVANDIWNAEWYEELPENKLKSYKCKFCNDYHLTSKLTRTFNK